MAALEREPLKVRKCSIHFAITKYAREDAAQDVYMGNKFLALRKSEVAKAAPDRAGILGTLADWGIGERGETSKT